MRQCFEGCRLYCQRSCLMISGYFHFRGRAVCTPCISDAPRCFRAVFRKPVTGLFYFSLRFISIRNIIKKIQGRQFCTALRFFIESILNLKTSLPVYPRSYFNIESKESGLFINWFFRIRIFWSTARIPWSTRTIHLIQSKVIPVITYYTIFTKVHIFIISIIMANLIIVIVKTLLIPLNTLGNFHNLTTICDIIKMRILIKICKSGN